MKGSLNFAETGIWLLAGKGRASLRPPLLLFLSQTVHNPSKQRLIAPKGNRDTERETTALNKIIKRLKEFQLRVFSPFFLFSFPIPLLSFSFPLILTYFFRFLSLSLSRVHISFLYPSRSHSYTFFFFFAF